MKDLEKFTKDMEANENFREEIAAYAEELRKENERISKEEIIQKYAESKGYSISLEEINKIHKLSDEELANVSGGLMDEPDLHWSIPQGQPAPGNGFQEEVEDIPLIGGKIKRIGDWIDIFEDFFDWF